MNKTTPVLLKGSHPGIREKLGSVTGKKIVHFSAVTNMMILIEKNNNGNGRCTYFFLNMN